MKCEYCQRALVRLGMALVGSVMCCGALAADVPEIISTVMRKNAPTIMDVTFKVTSTKDFVNVRAVAWNDGERNFYNVIRPKTFVSDANGNPTSGNVGTQVKANTTLTLSWKVPADWSIDIAKVKFEILCSDIAQLPLKTITIPQTAKNGAFVVTYGPQTGADVFNALLWHYADGASDLALSDGYLTATNHVSLTDNAPLVSRTTLASNLNCLEYVYDKMGYGLLNGALQEYARQLTRLALEPGGTTVYAYKRDGAPESVYLGANAFCVIDVSAGAEASAYPVTYLDSAPTAGWGDEFKTTKILLRRIEPGTFNMSGRTTNITKPFYMGVFQITQKQYELVTGGTPSYYKGALRPVENVSWNMIRGDSGTYNWPNVTTVDANTFVGRIQARTGLAFDLPTEAQWEYACRSGTTGYYNNGNDCSLLGRYSDTRNDYRGGFTEHTTVGLYLSNGLGLYDMHGNVCEWCLDWYGDIDTQAPANDPVGADSGSGRVLRGGDWSWYDSYCRSSYRDGGSPSSGYGDYGFRLSRALANDE